MVRQFREVIATDDQDVTLDDMRAGAEQTMAAVGVMPDGVTCTEDALAGRRTLVFDADAGRTDRVVLQFHGGAYVVNSVESHAKISAGLAKASGCRVVSFDYRMAPEYPFPTAVDDGLAAYRALCDSGLDPAHVAMTGDSAGGGLCLASCLAARDAGVPQPAALLLMSPWTDLAGTGGSLTTKAEVDLMVDAEVIGRFAAIYLDGAEPTSPLASPVYADLTGLPPMYIQVGGDETLLDDSTRVAVSAAHAGVDVRFDAFPEMQHVFQMGLGQLPESDDAIARAGAWLQTMFEASV
jgi:acetyl esterase/lipase